MCYGPSESFGLTIFNTKEQAAGSQNSPPILFSSSSLISLSTFFLIFFSPPLSLLFLIQHLFNLYRIPNKYSTNVHPIYLCPEQFLCLHSLFAFLCVSLYYFLYLFILLFFLHLLWIFFLFWLLIIISKVFISLSNCFNFFLILYSVLVSSLAVTPTDSFMSIAFPFLMIVPSPYFTFLEFLLFLASFFSFHCFLSMCDIPYLLFILSSYQFFSIVDLLSFLFLHGILVPLLLLSTCRLFIGATSFIIFIMFFHLFSLFILCWLSTI